MKTPLAVVRTADGRISAFANLVAATAAKAIAIDLRRQRADMMDGTLDFCLFLDFNTAKIRAMNAFISVSRHFRASANGPHWPGMERGSMISMSISTISITLRACMPTKKNSNPPGSHATWCLR